MDHSRFEIDEERPWDVVLVICLVEKDVLAVIAVHCEVFEDAIFADSMLCAKQLPKFHADLITALAHLKCDNLRWHINWDFERKKKGLYAA